MITLTLITAGLVILCVIFHGSFLQKLGSLLFKEKKFGFPKISLFIFLTVLAHLIEILFFTVAYRILSPNPNYGKIIGTDTLDWQDFYYFSAVTYTATGYGDLTPTGHLRLLATVEALTGLIMIAWTASLAYFIMSRYWTHRVPVLGNTTQSKHPSAD